MTGHARRAVAAVALLALAALAASAAAWRTAATLTAQRGEFLASVSRLVGWPIEAGSIDVAWFPPALVARDVSVPDESPYGPGTLAYAEEARFELSLGELLRGRIVVDDVRLQAPVLRAVRGADGGWNLRRRRPGTTSPGLELRGSPTGPGVSVQSIRVRDGRLSLRDRGVAGIGEYELRDLDLRLRRIGSALDLVFEGRALGGPAGNLSGSVRIPPLDGPAADASIEFDARKVDGARLAELVSLLRGRLPFGAAVDGDVDLRARATLPSAWPPVAADIALSVRADDATLRTAGGWIGKPAGSRLDADLDLRTGTAGLGVASADIRLDGGTLRIRPAAGPAGEAQVPLVFSSDKLDARALARWIPALASIEPSGGLAFEGRIEPGRPVTGLVAIRGDALRVAPGGLPVDIGGGEVRLDLNEDGDGVAGSLAITRVDGVAARMDGVEGRIETRPDGLTVVLAAREGGLRELPLRRIGLEATVVDGGIEIRAAHADALGGTVLAKGRIAHEAGGRWDAVVDPTLDAVDLAGLLSVIGSTTTGRGTLAGAAHLSTSGSDLDEALRNLAGDFEVRLHDGEIGGLNLAGTTLSGLRSVPGLRDAVLRVARSRAPQLVAETSSIGTLAASGRVDAGALLFDHLRLANPDYSFDARGKIGFDGGTDIQGRLALSGETSRALVADAGLVSLLAGDDGLVTIPIVVRGTYPHLSGAPASDFAARLASRAVGGSGSAGLGDWVKSLLGSHAGKSAGGSGTAPAR